MPRWIFVGVTAAALAGAGQLQPQAQQAPADAAHAAVTGESAARAIGSAATGRALLDRYCVACHNERLRTADLTLDTLSLADVGDAAATWEHVVRRLRAGAMPPAGRPRPTAAASHAFVSWLETELDTTALANPDPGRPTIHRLNRAEYANAVRDLFGLEIDVNALLPADDEQHGFDNIAEVLSVSPTLIERYLAAARRISQLAVGDLGLRPAGAVYPVHGALDQDGTVSDDLPFGSRGGVAVHHNFPVDGEYIIRIGLRKQEYGYVRGLGLPHRMEVRVDGALVGTFTVGREWEPEQLPPMGYAGKFRPGVRHALLPGVGGVRADRGQRAGGPHHGQGRTPRGRHLVRSAVGAARGHSAPAARPLDLLLRAGRAAGRQPGGVRRPGHRSLQPERGRRPAEPREAARLPSGRGTRRPRKPASGPGSPPSRAARTAGRRPTPTWTRCWRSTATAVRRGASTPACGRP